MLTTCQVRRATSGWQHWQKTEQVKRNQAGQPAQGTALHDPYLMGSDVGLHQLVLLQQVGDRGQVLAVILCAQHLLHLSTQHNTPVQHLYTLTCQHSTTHLYTLTCQHSTTHLYTHLSTQNNTPVHIHLSIQHNTPVHTRMST